MEVSPIIDGLWMSGSITPSGSYRNHGIDVVITLDQTWHPAGVYGDTLLVRWPINDGPMEDQPGGSSFEETVRAVAKFAAHLHRAGHQVLIHCTAGWNRSGLVMARTLMYRKRMSPQTAIDLIRERRSPSACGNPYFNAWLMKEGPSLQRDLARQSS